MKVAQLAPGLWHWVARHPDWTPEDRGPDGWEPEVSCYALVEDGELVLFDPLVPDDAEERFWRALDEDVHAHGPPQVLLTVYWHARSSQRILDRYEGSRVWVPDVAEDKLRERTDYTDVFSPGSSLPARVEARATVYREEVVFWLAGHRALIAGDVLLGTPQGGLRPCPVSWRPGDVTRERFHSALRPLLELPIELVLLAHGEPVLSHAHSALAAILRT